MVNNKLKTFSKKEAQTIIEIIKKDLKGIKLSETDEEMLLLFDKHVKRLKLNCIIISKEKIVNCFGKKVEEYINFKISNYLRDCVNDNHLATKKGGHLEIINKKYISGKHIYHFISDNWKNIGGIIFNYPVNITEEQIDFICLF